MKKILFLLLTVLIQLNLIVSASENDFLVKIDHENLSLNSQLVDRPELDTERDLLLKKLLQSLREDEEYSKVAVENAISFISKNKTASQALFVKFCLGYYLSEISFRPAGNKKIFDQLTQDSSIVMASILKSYENSWYAKFVSLMTPMEIQITCRDIDPDFNKPQVLEILTAILRKNIPKIREFEKIDKDKNYNEFSQKWLQNPFTEEFARYSIISTLIDLNKKEATEEYNNFKSCFPTSEHLKELEKEFSASQK